MRQWRCWRAIMNFFLPVTKGEYTANVAPDFLSALAARVRSGLFPMASPKRNAYEVVMQTPDNLRFTSTNILTGINVGLNDVNVFIDKSTGRASFEIRYWTWAKYGVALCLTLFVLGLCSFTIGRMVLPALWFADLDRFPAMAWGMLFFWGLIWPWILIAMHKPHVRRCLTHIMDEVNVASSA